MINARRDQPRALQEPVRGGPGAEGTWICTRDVLQSRVNDDTEDRVAALELALDTPEVVAYRSPNHVHGSPSAREAVVLTLARMDNHLRHVLSVADRVAMMGSRHPEIRDLVPLITPPHWVLRWMESGTPEERSAAIALSAEIVPRASHRARRR